MFEYLFSMLILLQVLDSIIISISILDFQYALSRLAELSEISIGEFSKIEISEKHLKN